MTVMEQKGSNLATGSGMSNIVIYLKKLRTTLSAKSLMK